MIKQLSLNHNIDYFNEPDPGIIAQLYYRHIFERIHKFKFNFLGMFVGKHRTAKSTTALAMSYVLDPTFYKSLEDRVVYFPNEFMRALISIKKKNIIGGAIIWDEAGVGIPAREWYDLANKSISYTLQVFGRYRPIVLFVSPDISYIDSQARRLFHAHYEMNRVGNDYAIARPFDVKYNRRNPNKMYYVYSRLKQMNDDVPGTRLILKKLKIRKPFEELEERYELHSRIFKDKIVDQMKERSEHYQKGDVDSNKMTIEEIIDDVTKNKESPRLLSRRSNEQRVIFDKDSIRFKYDIADSLARHIKKEAENVVNKIPDEEKIVVNVPKEVED